MGDLFFIAFASLGLTGVMLFLDQLSQLIKGRRLGQVEWVVLLAIVSSLFLSKVQAQDNDDLAFEFINTGAEVMSVAYECKDKLTAKEWSVVQDNSMANVVLDPRDYCESLKEELKKIK